MRASESTQDLYTSVVFSLVFCGLVGWRDLDKALSQLQTESESNILSLGSSARYLYQTESERVLVSEPDPRFERDLEHPKKLLTHSG